MAILSCTYLDKKEFIPVYIEVTSGGFNIPENYKSYTLFFATSYETADILTKKSRNKIKKQFKMFGESIGYENIAVWVKSPYSEDLNIELGKTYSDRLHRWHNLSLDYSDGPYLIFMTHSPDIPPMNNDYAVAISFKNKTPSIMTEAIEFLEAKIRRNEISKHDIQAKDFWLDLKSFLSEHSETFKEITKEIIIIIAEKRL